MAKTRTKRAAKTIRLMCNGCERADCDGITAKQLRFLRSKAGGWKNVSREQTYAQACKVYDDPRDAPPGYSVFDWWTHRGDCPECVKEEAEDKRQRDEERRRRETALPLAAGS